MRRRYPGIDEGWEKISDDGKFQMWRKDGKTLKITIIDDEIVESRISDTSENELKTNDSIINNVLSSL